MRPEWSQSLRSLANSTAATVFFVFALVASAAVAAVWLIAFEEEESSWIALAILFVSVLVLYGVVWSTYSHGQAEKWMALYPGPVSFSAPLSHRLLLCLGVMLLAGLLFYSVGIRGGPGRLDDWDPLNLMMGGVISLSVALGALSTLPRRELVLSLEGFEYRAVTGRFFYRWEDISEFRLVGRANILACVFAHQSGRRWLGRKSQMISAPLGLFRTTLRLLMTSWRKRALDDPQRCGTAHRSTGASQPPRSRSLLDYA